MTLGFGNLPAMLSLIPTLLLIALLGWSVALCCGLTNVIFQDTQHLVEVLFQILFYLTPVMYPAKILAERRMQWLVTYNPLAALLELVRRRSSRAAFRRGVRMRLRRRWSRRCWRWRRRCWCASNGD